MAGGGGGAGRGAHNSKVAPHCRQHVACCCAARSASCRRGHPRAGAAQLAQREQPAALRGAAGPLPRQSARMQPPARAEMQRRVHAIVAAGPHARGSGTAGCARARSGARPVCAHWGFGLRSFAGAYRAAQMCTHHDSAAVCGDGALHVKSWKARPGFATAVLARMRPRAVCCARLHGVCVPACASAALKPRARRLPS